VAPPGDSVGFRAYVLGIVPVDGQFERFHGRLSLADPCHLDLEVETASLVLSNPDRTRQVTGPEFLDAARFPALRFSGDCRGETLDGVLTLHGVSRPLALTITRENGLFRAVGEAVRADWGITAQPLIIGARLRLSLDIKLP